MINIKKLHIDDIKRYAETEYPYECCGILLGKVETNKSKTVEQILPISNAQEDKHKHNRFLITPEEMMRAELLARKNKIDVLGFYHSHPEHLAVPSDYDLDHAWPMYSYIIVSVIRGTAENFTSWELQQDRLKFSSESIKEGD